jgi:hypothetical protein
MKPEALRLLGRASCTWEDSIKMGAEETGWEGVNWIHVAGCCEHGNEHLECR